MNKIYKCLPYAIVQRRDETGKICPRKQPTFDGDTTCIVFEKQDAEILENDKGFQHLFDIDFQSKKMPRAYSFPTFE